MRDETDVRRVPVKGADSQDARKQSKLQEDHSIRGHKLQRMKQGDECMCENLIVCAHVRAARCSYAGFDGASFEAAAGEIEAIAGDIVVMLIIDLCMLCP